MMTSGARPPGRIQRRWLLAGGGAAAVVAGLHPRSVWAQPDSPARTIGWLDPFQPAFEPHAPFVRELAGLGWQPGKTLTVVARQVGSDPERLFAAARDLAAGVKVEVLVAYLDIAIAAARRATREIPVVMIESADPVAAGHVASLGRPGANVTGVASAAAEVATKQVDLLRQAVPRLARLAVLRHPLSSEAALRQVEIAARSLSIPVRVFEVQTRRDVEQAYAALVRPAHDAILVLSGGLMDAGLGIRIGELTRQHRLPVMADVVSFPYQGALMSYATSYAPQARRGAHFVDRILKGARPADLPVEQPSQFDFVINAETARHLRLTLPQTLIIRADKIIE